MLPDSTQSTSTLAGNGVDALSNLAVASGRSISIKYIGVLGMLAVTE